MKTLFTLLIISITIPSFSQDFKKWFPEGGQYYSTKLIAQEDEYKYLFLFHENGGVYIDCALKPKTPNNSAKIDEKVTFSTSVMSQGDISGKMKIKGDFKDYEYKFVNHHGTLLFAFKDVFSQEWNYFIWSSY